MVWSVTAEGKKNQAYMHVTSFNIGYFHCFSSFFIAV